MAKHGITGIILLVFFFFSFATFAGANEPANKTDLADFVQGMERHQGFFSFYWDQEKGKVWLEISRLGSEFLYVNSLATGLGSNPIGLDRSQLGQTRIVHFQRVGPRILLVQKNLDYRALTENAAEKRAVEESFAMSILWGTEIVAEANGRVLVDATSFLFRDAHDVIGRLRNSEQGTYNLDRSRSAVYLDRTKAFPDNSEFEVTLTFGSHQAGRLVSQVTPTPRSVTVRQHHSLIRLPEPGYQTREFDPRMASYAIQFSDYASGLNQSLTKRFISRHRMQRKDPTSQRSEAIEPLVYYVDPGAPEPIRSALITGASWWNQAFEAAGYENAFQVEVLPEGANPLDIRYNVIQWVHRSTRGWSYGSSVTDPRTGEIIKGHVQLGSLRVRQDRMLIEGLQPIFNGSAASCSFSHMGSIAYLSTADPDTPAVEVALARIRQLSAHEVGHTLGFTHNFAASTYAGRASVMDYPAPLVKVGKDNTLDLSDAYAVGIGEWDKVAIRYAYSDFGDSDDTGLKDIVKEAIDRGLLFLSDADARPPGAAHPLASLWDNGADPVAALEHTMKVRRIALNSFGTKNLPDGQPLSELRNVLVPLYLHHRYQVEAATKTIGGVYYSYKVKGDALPDQSIAPADQQRRALEVVLGTLNNEELTLDPALLGLLYPSAFGYSGTGEQFSSQAEPVFDPLSAATTAADITLAGLLQHHRAARLSSFHAQNPALPSLEEVIDSILIKTWKAPTPASDWEAATARVVDRVALDHLILLAGNTQAATDVRTIAAAKLVELKEYLEKTVGSSSLDQAHRDSAARRITSFLERPYPPFETPELPPVPPGMPIGAEPR